MSEKILANRKFLEEQVKLMFEMYRPQTGLPGAEFVHKYFVEFPEDLWKSLKKQGRSINRSMRVSGDDISSLIRSSLQNRKDSIPYIEEIREFLSLFNDYVALEQEEENIENIDFDAPREEGLLSTRGPLTNYKSYRPSKDIVKTFFRPRGEATFNYSLQNLGPQDTRNPIYANAIKKMRLFQMQRKNRHATRYLYEYPKNLANEGAQRNYSYDALAIRTLKIFNRYVKLGQIDFNPEYTFEQNLSLVKRTFIERVKTKPRLLEAWWKFISASVFDPTGVYNIDEFSLRFSAGSKNPEVKISDIVAKILLMIFEEEVVRKLATTIATRLGAGAALTMVVSWVIIIFYIALAINDFFEIIQKASKVTDSIEKLKEIYLMLQKISKEKRDATREENNKLRSNLNYVITFAREEILKAARSRIEEQDYFLYVSLADYIDIEVRNLSKTYKKITKENAEEVVRKIDEQIREFNNIKSKYKTDWFEDFYLTLENKQEKQTLKEQTNQTNKTSKFSSNTMKGDIANFLNKYGQQSELPAPYNNPVAYNLIIDKYKIEDGKRMIDLIKTSNNERPAVSIKSLSANAEDQKLNWKRLWSNRVQNYDYNLVISNITKNYEISDEDAEKFSVLFDRSGRITDRGVSGVPTVFRKSIGNKKIIPFGYAGALQYKESGAEFVSYHNSCFFFYQHPLDTFANVFDSGQIAGLPQDTRIQSLTETDFWKDSFLSKINFDTPEDALKNKKSNLETLKKSLRAMAKYSFSPARAIGQRTKAGDGWNAQVRDEAGQLDGDPLDFDNLINNNIDQNLQSIVEGSRRIANLLRVEISQLNLSIKNLGGDKIDKGQLLKSIINADQALTTNLKDIDNKLTKVKVGSAEEKQLTQQFLEYSTQKINNFYRIKELEN